MSGPYQCKNNHEWQMFLIYSGHGGSHDSKTKYTYVTTFAGLLQKVARTSVFSMRGSVLRDIKTICLLLSNFFLI